MSRPPLHHVLQELFEHKNQLSLEKVLTHSDFVDFLNEHSLKIPLTELTQAFVHTSFSHEFKVSHQEQLEFLGDAVLGLILSEELFRRFPQEKEGRLSKMRSSIVNENSLARLGRHIRLNELVLVGKGEFQKGLYSQEVVLADTFEALLAQIYRFHGLNFTHQLLMKWIGNTIPEAFDLNNVGEFDVKSKLQELSLAKYKKLPRYLSSPRNEMFLIELWINDELISSGVFSSKKSGEKELAKEALRKGII